MLSFALLRGIARPGSRRRSRRPVIVPEQLEPRRMLSRMAIADSFDTFNAHDVVVSDDGRYVFVADGTAGLKVLDLVTEQTGSLDTPGFANGLALSPDGNQLYLAEGNPGLTVVDVSEPLAPSLITTFDTTGYAIDVAVQQTGQSTTAYVADQGRGLRIIDVTNPAAPALLRSVGLPGSAYDVVLSAFGDYAFVADQNGLQVIDISDPQIASRVGGVITPGSAEAVRLSADGQTAYLADGAAGLQIVDIATPALPEIVNTVDTRGSAEGLAVGSNGLVVYVADNSGGLHEVNVADPARAWLMQSLDTPDIALDVAVVSNELVVLADRIAGVHLVQLSPSSIDFNGDGISDEVFRNEQTGGWVAIFRTADGSKTGELALGGNLAWTIQATGDFDGDGVTDIVWRYQPPGPTEGRALIHLRGAGGVTASIEIGGNAFWQVEATGDFDGDGDDDIMWRNNVSGKILGWEMQGGRQSGPGVWMGGNTHWRLVATSSIYDANADGRTDLIFVHTSGRHILWHMNGLAYQHYELARPGRDFQPEPGVFVAGTGDFDGDGQSDLLWRNEQTGAITMWLMHGTGATPRNGGSFPLGGNLYWSAEGLADYDGDGRTDIIWHSPGLSAPFWVWSMRENLPTDTRWVTDLPGTPSDYTPLRRPGRTSG